MFADNWIKVADSIEDIPFSNSGIAELTLAGRNICLIKQGERLFACSAKCPHAGANLAKEGLVTKQGHIICCVHNYRFDLKTGRDPLNEGYFLKVYKVDSSPDGIYVNIKTQ